MPAPSLVFRSRVIIYAAIILLPGCICISRQWEVERISLEHSGIESPVFAIQSARDGTTLVAAYNGLFEHTPRGWRRFQVNGYSSAPFTSIITSLLISSDGTMWIGTPESLFRLKDGSTIDITNQLPASWDSASRRIVPIAPGIKLVQGPLSIHYINVLFESTGGDVWIGTGNGGLFRHSHITSQIHLIRRSSQIDGTAHNRWVSSICEDASGQIWFTVKEEGLFAVCDPLAIEQRKNDPLIDSARFAATGDKWILNSEGILKHYESYRADVAVIGSVRAITQDSRGRVWATTSKGIWAFTDGVWRQADSHSNSVFSRIYSAGEYVYVVDRGMINRIAVGHNQ